MIDSYITALPSPEIKSSLGSLLKRLGALVGG